MRTLTCIGGCGLEEQVSDVPDERGHIVLEIECEQCYVRDHGPPAAGFVGFVDGRVRTVGRPELLA